MRVILDTNILVSALLSGGSLPARLVLHWRQGRFVLLTCMERLEEVRRVTRYPRIRERLAPALAGRLVNELRAVAELVSSLPEVSVSSDPWDNYLLAMAEAGKADVLATGDKADLLHLGRHGPTEIISARQLLDRLEGIGKR